MRRFGFALVTMFVLLALGIAQAGTISFVGIVGSYGSSTHTFPGAPGITAAGFYFDTVSNTWKPANLFGRNDNPTDHGLGVCDPKETANCGTGVGGGDYNELSNELAKELIRLTLPAGFHWVSVQLSSLDNNGSTDPNQWERGQLMGSNTADPNANGGGGSVICNFAAGGAYSCTQLPGGSAAEPVLGVPTANANTGYLFFRPKDWLNGTNKNNDFLVMKATIATNVPEPASMLLLGTGIAGLVARRKLRA